jgi:hypothetical protein
MHVEVSEGACRFLGNTDLENLRRRILQTRDRDYPGREQEKIFLDLGMPGQLSALTAKVRGSSVVNGKEMLETFPGGYFVGPPESKGLAGAGAVAPSRKNRRRPRPATPTTPSAGNSRPKAATTAADHTEKRRKPRVLR